MKSKNIVFTKPNTAEILEEEVLSPKGDGVLVKLAFSTISSGTERANLVGNPVNGLGKSVKDKAIFQRLKDLLKRED